MKKRKEKNTQQYKIHEVQSVLNEH